MLALVVAACGDDNDDVRVADPLPTQPGEWMRFVPASVELDGTRYTPTCSGAPGTDPSYHFWARRGSANRLVVFFEGGGACWDGATCAFPIDPDASPDTPQLYAAEIGPDQDPRALGGMFDLDNVQNPIGDWSFVYVPYCTGDIHSGSATRNYVNPFTGQSYVIQHRGADNFRVILEWARQNFRNPEQILVSGSSAGGYGAVTHFSALRQMYGGSRAAMLSDAAQAVVPPGFDEQRNASWNLRPPPEVFGPNPEAIPSGELLARLASHFPDDRFGQYTTSIDFGQIAFYDAMVNGLGGTQGTACTQWSETMRAELAVRQRTPNFRSYVGAGTEHMILRGNHPGPSGRELFYRETSAGMPFTDWLSAMLSPSGAGWVNASCTNCSTLPFACPF